MKAMDIRITDTIVCYDFLGMLAAPRVSWMLRAFGAKNVFVLVLFLTKFVFVGYLFERKSNICELPPLYGLDLLLLVVTDALVWTWKTYNSLFTE